MASVQALVFVKDLLITGRLPLQSCTVYPLKTSTGVEADIGMINRVVRELLGPDIQEIQLGERQRKQNREHQCVLHFPSIDPQRLRQTYTDVVQALSLARSSSAVVYATVTYDPGGRGLSVIVPRRVYRGNLVGGILSGEDPDLLNGIIAKLQQTPLLRVYLDLFNHALAERDPGLRYFRYWQVLEGLAQMRTNSDSDFHEKPAQSKNRDSKTRVHNLIAGWKRRRRVAEVPCSDVPETVSLRQYVVWWHAMRSCIAHHGRFAPGDSTLKASFRDYAKCEEIFCKQRYDLDGFILEALEEETEFVVRCELLTDDLLSRMI